MAKRRQTKSQAILKAREVEAGIPRRTRRPNQVVLDREQEALVKSAKAKLRYHSWRELTARERKALQREAMAGRPVPKKVPRKYTPVPQKVQESGTASTRRESLINAQERRDAKQFAEYQDEELHKRGRIARKKRMTSRQGATMGPVAAAGRSTGPPIQGPYSKAGLPSKKRGLSNLLERTMRKSGGLSGIAGKAGKGALKAAPAIGIGLGILQLLSYGKEQYDASEELSMLKASPEIDARAYLKGMRKQQLMMARQGRLMREDPEAYRAMQDYAGGVSAPTPLATGEFVVGGAPQNQPGSSEEVRALLARM